MSDLGNYLRAQAELKAAKNLHNYAGSNLRLKQICCRHAELESQHEPLNSLCDGDPELRRKICEAIFYVVVGRSKS